MKIILPLHNEKRNSFLDNIKTSLIEIQTSDISIEYQSLFYCEVGKLIWFSKQIECNDNIIGFIQNRRFFKNLTNINETIFNEFDIILAKPHYYNKMNFYEKLLNQFYSSLMVECIIDFKSKNILEKNTDFLNSIHDNYISMIKDTLNIDEINILQYLTTEHASFHNIFITKNEIFYEYANYLDDKLLKLKKTKLFNDFSNNKDLNFHNLKLGAWFSERLLNVFVILNKLKSCTFEYLEFEK